MLTTTQLRAVWGNRCTDDRVTITLWSGAKVTVRRQAKEAFEALNVVMKAHGYFQRPEDTGAFVCRAITGGTGLSLHALAIAQDTNWKTNPYGPKFVTDRPRAMVDHILAIRTKSGVQVFRWGGYYTGNKDTMHDEIVCSPTDLASGIDWATVYQGEEDDMANISQEQADLMLYKVDEMWKRIGVLDNLDAHVRGVLNEATGEGQTNWAGTVKATLAAVQGNFNAINVVTKYVKDLALLNGSTEADAAKFAEAVAKDLAERLANK